MQDDFAGNCQLPANPLKKDANLRHPENQMVKDDGYSKHQENQNSVDLYYNRKPNLVQSNMYPYGDSTFPPESPEWLSVLLLMNDPIPNPCYAFFSIIIVMASKIMAMTQPVIIVRKPPFQPKRSTAQPTSAFAAVEPPR